jgi:hypothetical protein
MASTATAAATAPIEIVTKSEFASILKRVNALVKEEYRSPNNVIYSSIWDDDGKTLSITISTHQFVDFKYDGTKYKALKGSHITGVIKSVRDKTLVHLNNPQEHSPSKGGARKSRRRRTSKKRHTRRHK